MNLFKKKEMKRNLQLTDETGKKLDAKLVFSLAIQYIYNDVISTIKKGLLGDVVRSDELHWVLTVPAIWNDAAKQFMREAAEHFPVKPNEVRDPDKPHGIRGDRLTIALEPEAASLFCRALPITKQGHGSLVSLLKGTKYMTIDSGGGTVDITVHQVVDDSRLRELYKASGGAWGGTYVDMAFEKFIDNITGNHGVIGAFKQLYMEDYLEFSREFENKKRTFDPIKTTTLTFRVTSLMRVTKTVTGQTLERWIDNSQYCGKLRFTGDKLRVDRDIALLFFDSPVHNIVSHVEQLLKERNVAGCDTLLLVGGFSESPVLQEAIKHHFNGLKVIVPVEPSIVVLKGAVICGHAPRLIQERVCSMTYGTAISHEYNAETCTHPKGGYINSLDGKQHCSNLFDIHVQVEDIVEIGKEQKERISVPLDDEQESITMYIYASEGKRPQLVTEPGCTKIGKLRIPIRDTSSGRKHEFGTSFMFGGTEIEVKVVDKVSREEFQCRIDFLG